MFSVPWSIDHKVSVSFVVPRRSEKEPESIKQKKGSKSAVAGIKFTECDYRVIASTFCKRRDNIFFPSGLIQWDHFVPPLESAGELISEILKSIALRELADSSARFQEK